MEKLKELIIGDIEPDLTFILDIDPKIGLKRSLERSNIENRFENYDIDFHNKIRNAFLNISKQNKDRCIVIDASISKQEINKIIISEINQLISNN